LDDVGVMRVECLCAAVECTRLVARRHPVAPDLLEIPWSFEASIYFCFYSGATGQILLAPKHLHIIQTFNFSIKTFHKYMLEFWLNFAYLLVPTPTSRLEKPYHHPYN
jgi:hypothetical protein